MSFVRLPWLDRLYVEARHPPSRSPAGTPAWISGKTSDMSFNPDTRQLGLIKTAVFAICLLPFARLLWAAYANDFGPNPVEFVQRWTGTWTFNLLLITLCVTPLRSVTKLPWLIRLRRMAAKAIF